MAVVSLSGHSEATASVDTPKLSVALWIVQALLAVVFLGTGLMKLTAPSEMLAAQVPLPEAFVRFLGLAETLGAIGLILPGLLRIRTGLTPLAACGLVIMMGATVLTPTLLGMDLIMALPTVVIGALAAAIAYSRWQLAPLKSC